MKKSRVKNAGIFGLGLGLVSAPIAAIVACGPGLIEREIDPDKKEVKEDNHWITKLGYEYQVENKSVDILNYHEGYVYSARELGINPNNFPEGATFVPTQIFDLTGEMEAELHHREGELGYKHFRHSRIKIKGYQSKNASQVFRQTIENLKKITHLQTALGTQVASYEVGKTYSLKDLGLWLALKTHVRNYLEWRAKVSAVDTSAGTLQIELSPYLIVTDQGGQPNEVASDLSVSLPVTGYLNGKMVRDIHNQLGEWYQRENFVRLQNYANETRPFANEPQESELHKLLPSQIAKTLDELVDLEKIGLPSLESLEQQGVFEYPVALKFKLENVDDSKGSINLGVYSKKSLWTRGDISLGVLQINGYFNTQRKFELETATEFEKALHEKLPELPGLEDPSSFNLKTASVTLEQFSTDQLNKLAQETLRSGNFSAIEKVTLQAKANDLDGQITLHLTIWPTDEKIKVFHHEIKISGFHKLSPEKIEKVSAAKEWVKSPFNHFDRVIPGSNRFVEKLMSEMIGIEEFAQETGFELKYQVDQRQTNANTGDLWFTYQVWDGKALVAEGQTKWELLTQAEFDRLKEILTESIKSWEGQNLRDKFDWANKTLPSEFVQKDSGRIDRIEKFLDQHMLPWDKIGRKLSWDISVQSTPNDEKGYVTLIVEIMDDNKPITEPVVVKLTGFSTQKERDEIHQKAFDQLIAELQKQTDQNQLVDAKEKLTLPTTFLKGDFYEKWISATKERILELFGDSASSFELTITARGDDQDGTIKLVFALSKLGDSWGQQGQLTLKGFYTKTDMVYVEYQNKVVEQLKNNHQEIVGDLINSVLSPELQSEIEKQIRKTLEQWDSAPGAEVVIEMASDEYKGILTLKIFVKTSAREYPADEITIGGFKTKIDAFLEEFDNKLSKEVSGDGKLTANDYRDDKSLIQKLWEQTGPDLKKPEGVTLELSGQAFDYWNGKFELVIKILHNGQVLATHKIFVSELKSREQEILSWIKGFEGEPIELLKKFVFKADPTSLPSEKIAEIQKTIGETLGNLRDILDTYGLMLGMLGVNIELPEGIELTLGDIQADDEFGAITVTINVYYEHKPGADKLVDKFVFVLDGYRKLSELEVKQKIAKELREKLVEIKTLELENKNILPSSWQNMSRITEQIKQLINFEQNSDGLSLLTKVVDADDQTGTLTIGVWVLVGEDDTENRIPDHKVTIGGLLNKKEIENKEKIEADLKNWLSKVQTELESKKDLKPSQSVDLVREYFEKSLGETFSLPSNLKLIIDVRSDDENDQIKVTFQLERAGKFWTNIGKTTITGFGKLEKLEKIAEGFRKELAKIEAPKLANLNVLPSEVKNVDKEWLDQIKKLINFEKASQNINLVAEIVNASDKEGSLTIGVWISIKGQDIDSQNPDQKIKVEGLLSLKELETKNQIETRLQDWLPKIQEALLPENLGNASESAQGIREYLESFVRQALDLPGHMDWRVEATHDDEKQLIELNFKLMRHGQFWTSVGKTTITDFGQRSKLEKIAQQLKEKLAEIKTLELENRNVLPSDLKIDNSKLTQKVKTLVEFNSWQEGINLASKVTEINDEKGTLTIGVWILIGEEEIKNRAPDHTFTIDGLLNQKDVETSEQIKAQLKELVLEVEKQLENEKSFKPSKSVELIREHFEKTLNKMLNLPTGWKMMVTAKEDDENNQIELIFQLERAGKFWTNIGKTTITGFGKLEKLEKIVGSLRKKLLDIQTLEIENLNVLPKDFENVEENWTKQIKELIGFEKDTQGISLILKIVNTSDEEGSLTIGVWIHVEGQNVVNKNPDHQIKIKGLISLEDISIKNKIKTRLQDWLPKIQEALLPEGLDNASKSVQEVEKYLESFVRQALDLPSHMDWRVEATYDDEKQLIELNLKLMRHGQLWTSVGKTTITNFGQRSKLEKIAQQLKEKLAEIKTLELENRNVLPSDLKSGNDDLNRKIKTLIDFDPNQKGIGLISKVVEIDDEKGILTIGIWIVIGGENAGKRAPDHKITIEELVNREDLEIKERIKTYLKNWVPEIQDALGKEKHFKPSESEQLIREHFEKTLNKILNLPSNWKLVAGARSDDENNQVEITFEMFRNGLNWTVIHQALIKGFDQTTRLEEYVEKLHQRLSNLKTLELSKKNILPSSFEKPENLELLTDLVKESIGWDSKTAGLRMRVYIFGTDDENGTMSVLVWVGFEHLALIPEHKIGPGQDGFVAFLVVEGLLKKAELETQRKKVQETKAKLLNLKELEIKHKNFLPSEMRELDYDTVENIKKLLGINKTSLDPRISIKIIGHDDKTGKIRIGVWIFSDGSEIDLSKPDKIFDVDGFVREIDLEDRVLIIQKLGDWITQKKDGLEIKNKEKQEIEDSIFKGLLDDKTIELPDGWGWDVKLERDDQSDVAHIKISLLRNGDHWCEVSRIEIKLNKKSALTVFNQLLNLPLEKIWQTTGLRS